MRLTKDYRSILASFDRSVDFVKVFENGIANVMMLIDYEFEIGPLTYKVVFSGKKKNFSVHFNIERITGTDEELGEFFSKVFRKEITPEEVIEIKSYILNNTMEDVGVGNAITVFATVLATMRDVVKRHPVDCFQFVGMTEKKARIYRRMIQNFSNEWEQVPGWTGGFQVCKKK